MWTCKQCGFQIAAPSAHQRARKYCSQRCHYDSRRLTEQERKRHRVDDTRRYYLRHRQKILACAKLRPKTYIAWVRGRASESALAKRKTNQALHRAKNKVRINARISILGKKQAQELRDVYVQKLLLRSAILHGIPIQRGDIPPKMVAAAREIIRVKRQLQEMTT